MFWFGTVLLTGLKWLRNNLLGMAKLRQTNVGNYMNFFFFTFDFHILTEHRCIGGKIFPWHYISIKMAIIHEHDEVGVDPFT